MNRRELASFRRERRSANLGAIISSEIVIHELARFLEAAFPNPGGTLLDLGAGTRPYAPLYEPHFQRCVSVDVEYSPHDVSGIDVIASADDLPFENDSFDC